MATKNDFEQQFLKCASEFNEARILWHHYMDEHIEKHGMPTLYAGSVSYNHDREYKASEKLAKFKKLSAEERDKKFKEEIDYLQKWKFPGTYSVAIFTGVTKVVILGEAFKMTAVKSFSFNENDKDIVYTIKITRAGYRTVSVPKSELRANQEMKSILGACQMCDGFGTSYNDIEDIFPVTDPYIDSTVISFEGVPLGLPVKEFVYAINHMDEVIPDLELSSFNPDFFRIKCTYEGYKVDWSFMTVSGRYVYQTMLGDTDYITGYDNIRAAYDKMVNRFKKLYGEPTTIHDVPVGVRKNSIMKDLREEKYKIETIFENDDIYASVEFNVDDEEKRNGCVNLYVSDNRLCIINVTEATEIEKIQWNRRTKIYLNSEPPYVVALKEAEKHQREHAVQTKKTQPQEMHPQKERPQKVKSNSSSTQKTQTKDDVEYKDSYDGCMIAACLVIIVPFILIASFILAALMVGDSSDEYGWWVFGTFIFFMLIFIPVMLMESKKPGGKRVRRRSSSSSGTGAALLGGAYFAHEAFDSSDGDKSDFDIEDYRSVAESRRFRSHDSGNWTSREDWDCGPTDNYDGMSGWDSYAENDF